MHGQPITKIHQPNYANPTNRIPSTKIRPRQLVRLIFVCQGTHTDFSLKYSLLGPTLTHRNTVNASTNMQHLCKMHINAQNLQMFVSVQGFSTNMHVGPIFPIQATCTVCIILDFIPQYPLLYVLYFCTVHCNIRNRGSSDGIATRYGLDGPGIESRCGRHFPHLSRPAVRSTQPHIQRVPGLSRG
jgi:hypothetical protein